MILGSVSSTVFVGSVLFFISKEREQRRKKVPIVNYLNLIHLPNGDYFMVGVSYKISSKWIVDVLSTGRK